MILPKQNQKSIVSELYGTTILKERKRVIINFPIIIQENMYKEKSRFYFVIALTYWIIYMIGLFVMGILYKKGISNYNIIYWIIAVIGVLIVIIKDKSITNLGFTTEKLKVNTIISLLIIIITFIISVIAGKYPNIKIN